MKDPLTVAYEIRRPWPKRTGPKIHAARWRITARSPFWNLAGRQFYFPSVITVWHRDPSGYDDITCRRKRWKLHVHHWRIQVQPLQQLRRRLLTRCTWCGGRDQKGNAVNVSHQWDGPRGRWWNGEPGLYHSNCSTAWSAHRTCLCDEPMLVEHGTWGTCWTCGKHRSYGAPPEWIEKARAIVTAAGLGTEDRND